MSNDPVRDFLEQSDCPPEVVRGGLRGLLEQWEAIVAEIEQGYAHPLDDYLNDLDIRQLLHDAVMLATVVQKRPYLERLQNADARAQARLEPAGKCLWGLEVAQEEGWDEEENWWYYHRPKDAAPEMLEEIEEIE